MQQASAWGQFWFDLSSIYRVQGSAIFTPLQTHIAHPKHRGAYYTTFFEMTSKGPIYHLADGGTMIEMLVDGLNKTGCNTARMKFSLLAIVAEQIERSLSRTDA